MNGVVAGIFSAGWAHEDAHRQHRDHADLHVRTEIIARAHQHPHRQDRGDRRIDRQDDRQLSSRRKAASPARPTRRTACRGTRPSSTSVTPISDASPTRPGRILYIQRPVIRAAGIVTTIVNMPQALSLRALTTTIATPASVAMMMNSVASVVVDAGDRAQEVAGRSSAATGRPAAPRPAGRRSHAPRRPDTRR